MVTTTLCRAHVALGRRYSNDFNDLRLLFGIAWMVLIAAEMLAQNPSLGRFAWDEFQNGGSNSLGRIMVEVFSFGNEYQYRM